MHPWQSQEKFQYFLVSILDPTKELKQLEEQTVETKNATVRATRGTIVRADKRAVKGSKTDIWNANIAKRNIRRKRYSKNMFARTVIRTNSLISAFSLMTICTYLGSDGSLVHKCICCYTYFRTKADRNEHVRVAHKHRVTCKICNKVFRNVDSLYSHKQFSHEKRTKRTLNYFCAKCGKCVGQCRFELIAETSLTSIEWIRFQAHHSQTKHIWMLMKNLTVAARPVSNAMIVENCSSTNSHWRTIGLFTAMKGNLHVTSVNCDSNASIPWKFMHLPIPLRSRINVSTATKDSQMPVIWVRTWIYMPTWNATCAMAAALDIRPIPPYTSIAKPEKILAPWCRFNRHWKLLNLKPKNDPSATTVSEIVQRKKPSARCANAVSNLKT